MQKLRDVVSTRDNVDSVDGNFVMSQIQEQQFDNWFKKQSDQEIEQYLHDQNTIPEGLMNHEMKVLDQSIKSALRPLLASIVCRDEDYFDQETGAFSQSVDPLKIHQVVDLSLLSAVPGLSLDYSGATGRYGKQLRTKYNSGIIPLRNNHNLLIGEGVQLVLALSTIENPSSSNNIAYSTTVDTKPTRQTVQQPRTLIKAPQSIGRIELTPLRSQMQGSRIPLPIPNAQKSNLLTELGPGKPGEFHFINPWLPNYSVVNRDQSYVNDDGTLGNRVNDTTGERQKIYRGDMIAETMASNLFVRQSEYENLSDQERADVCYNFFIDKGLSPEIAAGIVGNMWVESYDYRGDKSRLKTSVVQKGGDYAFGLCQWAGSRRGRLKEYASTIGLSPDDYWTQLNFVLYEFNQKEQSAYKSLIQADTVATATKTFTKKYERAGVPHLGKRLSAAQEIYQRNVD